VEGQVGDHVLARDLDALVGDVLRMEQDDLRDAFVLGDDDRARQTVEIATGSTPAPPSSPP
jgi:hypothetical protein